MALGYLDDSKLYAIASAIRAKTGDSATMTVDDMPDEIGSISTGAQVEPLSVTENGTYSAPTGYAYSPVTVNVSGGGGDWEPVGDGKTRFWVKGDKAINLLIAGRSATRDATIDWGDGGAIEQISETGSVRLTHTYSANDVYCIVLDGADFVFGGGTGSTVFSTYGTGSYPNKGTLLAVELGANCSKAGNNSFQTCSSLEAVFANCSRIENNAFYQCYALRTVELGPRLTYLGTSAFSYCYQIRSVVIPDSVRYLNNQVFSECSDLAEVTITNMASSIPQSFFSSCVALENVTVPASVNTIGAYAFYRCGRLSYIRMLPTTPPTLSNVNAFTDVTALIYVPSASVSQYKTATGWSNFADKIMADPNE